MNSCLRKKRILGALVLTSLAISVIFSAMPAYSKTKRESPEQPAEAKDILTARTPEQKLYILRKFDFINNALTGASNTGSTNADLTFEFEARQPLLYLTKQELNKIHAQGPDPFGADLHRRLSDTPPTLPIFTTRFLGVPDAIAKAPKFTSVPQFSIPNDTEIDVLKVLWQNPGGSSSDIYAALDPVTPVTAEDLQKVLESMSNRGLLVRRKISPSNNFSFFGIVSFEMSSLNRKNKLYVYWPVVPKGKLITYVDSQRYLTLASLKGKSTSDRKYSYQRYLEEKLYRLIQ